METKELNNYKIEFYSEEEWYSDYQEVHKLTIRTNSSQLVKKAEWYYKKGIGEYAGLVSEIPEELTEKIVDCIGGKLCNNVKQYNEYKDYNHNYDKDYKSLKTAKQSFQTLSDLEYCVITKIE